MCPAAFSNPVCAAQHTSLLTLSYCFPIVSQGLADTSQSQLQFKMHEDVIIHQKPV